MNEKKKVFCLLFAVLMLFTLSITAFAGNETNDGNIKIEVATNKDSYGATGVAEITATITNIGSNDLKNVTAQAVFDDLAPAGKGKSETSKSVDVLKSGESFSFKYKATLNKSEHKLNIFQKIILFFVRFFNGGYNSSNNNIDVVAENVTKIKFDKFTAKNVVQVGYETNDYLEIYINQNDFSTSQSKITIDGTINSSNEIKHITYSVENYSDNGVPSSKGFATIIEKEWFVNLSLKPDYNIITMTVEDITGAKISKQITVTYNSIVMYSPEEEHSTFDESSGLNYINNIIIVYFKSDISDKQINEIVNSFNGKIVGQNNTLDLYQIMIEKKSLDEIQLMCSELMNNYDEILYATYDTLYKDTSSLNFPNDPWDFDVNSLDWLDNTVDGSNWWAEAIELQYAWSYKNRFNYTTVGIYDSGFDIDHEDLKNKYAFPNSILEERNNSADKYHGTHVTGIIGAEADNKKGLTGVSINSKMLFAPYNESGENVPLENRWDASLYASLTYLVEAGAKVINFSQGKAKLLDPSKRTQDYIKREGNLASIAISKLLEKGYDFNIVQSAGNDGGIDSLNNGWFASITDDSITGSNNIDIEDVISRVIIVAAVAESSNENYILTDFSNCGDNISVAAPGEHIYSCIPKSRYAYEDGTSMATPVVTGVASLVWSVNPNFTAGEVKEIVCNYTNKTATGYGEDTRSYPIVNAKLAVEEAIRRTDNRTITGTVTDEETGDPIPNAWVIADSGQPEKHIAFTDENGYYELDLPDTLCELEFYHENYVEKKFSRHINEDIQIDVSLTPKSTIKNILLDNTWYNNIQDYCEYKFYEDGTVVENPDSDYSRTLTYSITDNVLNIYWDESEEPYTTSLKYVTKDDSYDWEKDLFFYNVIYNEIADDEYFLYEYDYEPDEMGLVNVMWLRCKNDTVEDDKIFTGTVLDEVTEAPISNVVVNITEQGDSLTNILEMVITDENGNFSLNLPDGDYTLEFLHDDYELDFAFITLGSDESNSIFYLAPLETRTITDSGTCGDNVTWTLYEDGELVISGSGEMGNYDFQHDGGYGVSQNTSPWYSHSNNITSVVIKNGITNIGRCAFYDCKNLTNLSLSDSLTSIGSYAFYNCTNLENFEFGKGITHIYGYAFQNCDSITDITIPGNVTTIGTSAFYGCDGLVNIVIEKGITNLGSIFVYCTSLRNVSIPNSVTSINSTFTHCTQLEKIVIPDSVTTISNAFYSCIGLKEVTIGKNLTTIGDGTFSGCSGIQKIVIPDSVTTIGNSAFSGCSALQNIAIPNSVTQIGNYAFYRCTGLKEVVIGDSVKNIGNYALQNCTGISKLTIGDSVVNIGSYAFQNCTGIKEIVIPDSVVTIGQYAFQNCTGAKDLKIGSGSVTIDSYAFSECTGLINIDLGNNITNIGSYAFNNCDGIANITIPDSVTAIEQYAFYSCDGLTTVNLGNGMSTLYHTFSNCTSLKNITIPESITIINGAFNNCISLKNITIPNNVTNINGAFSGCTQLEEIVIPDSVTTINSAFSGCKSLKRVSIGKNVTTIGDSAFSWCISLQSIIIPDSVTVIGISAFQNCCSLSEIVIPNSVSSISQYAFSGCSGAKEIIIGNGVKTIGVYSFQGCSGVSNLTIGNNVTNIYNHAFIGCTGIKEIILPISLKSIGERAFKDCIGLSTVYYKGSEEQWENIGISSDNSNLFNATIHHNYNA